MCETPMTVEEEDDLNGRLHHALRCLQHSQECGKKEKQRMEILFLRSAVWSLLGILGKNNAEVKEALQDRAATALNAIFKDMEDLEDDGEED